MMRQILLFLSGFIAFGLYSEVHLELASSNTQKERKATIRYLLDAFELENPDISVGISDYEDNASLKHLLSQEISLIMGDSLLLYGLAQQEVVDYDFNSRMIFLLNKDDFFTGCRTSFNRNEKLIGIPYSAWLQVIWYRKDWLAISGLPEPKTPDILKKAVLRFNKRADNFGIITGSADDSFIQQCFLHFAAADDFKLSQDESRFYVNKTDLFPILDYYKKLCDTSPAGDVTWRYRDYYFQEKAGILIYSTNLLDDLVIPAVAADSLGNQNFPDLKGTEYSEDLFRNTGMITILEGKEKAAFGSVSGIAAFKGMSDQQKAAAEKLIAFLYRSDVYICWLHMSPGGMLPVRPSILERDEFFRDPGGVFRRYGREKIIELTNGLEYLTIINPELIGEDPENRYQNRDFQHFIYRYIKDPEEVQKQLPNWIH